MAATRRLLIRHAEVNEALPDPSEIAAPVADRADQPTIGSDQAEPVLLPTKATDTNPDLTSPPPLPFHPPVPTTHRVFLATFGLFLLSGFSLSIYLKPNPQGFGTHRSLGLPPCSIRVMFGIPCPSCGMTTSFSHFVRGQIPVVAASQRGGNHAGCRLRVHDAVGFGDSLEGPTFPHRRPRHRVRVAANRTRGTLTAVHWVWRLWLDGYLP